MREYLEEKKRTAEKWIREAVSGYAKIQPLRGAIDYALSGGKRLRPILAMMAAEALGIDVERVRHIAVGVELIHNYSLVHDDLPCMDNDTLRHGQPCTHVKYGEGMGVLTGDALLNLAFEIMLDAPDITADYVRAVKYIAKAAGVNGMIGGQCLDLLEKTPENTRLSDIIRLNELKTARLFKAALAGAAISLGADAETVDAFELYAEKTGIIFQIVDDILDVTATEEKLGKNVRSDIESNKTTYIGLTGIEQARIDVIRYEIEATNALSRLAANENLIALVRFLSNRSY